MAKDHKTWQDQLLSSSAPLEYEVASLLRKAGFHISGEWLFHRVNDAGIEREWSVDLRAVSAPTLPNSDMKCTFDVLVECKYRRADVAWLFPLHPDNESSFLHSPLEGIDHFSPWFIHDLSWDLGNILPVCYKGFEVGFGTPQTDPDLETAGKSKGGEKALDVLIRHGLSQLQFALPALVAHRVRAAALRPADKITPFFYIPILVTNAELIVPHQSFGRAAVESAKTPADLGQMACALIVSREPGPDFAAHAQRQFRDLTQLVKSPSMQATEQFRKAQGFSEIELPSWIAKRIDRDGNEAMLLSKFANMLVCNIKFFANTLEMVNATFLQSAATIKKEPIIKWQ